MRFRAAKKSRGGPIREMKNSDATISQPQTDKLKSGDSINIKAVFFEALKNYVEKNNSAWHTPGHNGGAFFLRTPTGREFRDFVGDNICKADLSISVEELGTLLNHSGKMGEAEKNAARVFDADKTYFVLGGTSAANQIIFGACAGRGDDVVIDRNCHKSIYHALISSGANPLYISPLRNKMGMAGPITPESIARVLGARASTGALPRILTITNSNYDGVCTSVLPFEQNPSAANLHFDEAWFAHAKFSPIYDGFFALSGKRASVPVFVSQSTHKMLSALSQGSMLHARDGLFSKIPYGALEETYAMHTSTSPQYNIIASLDAAASIMAEAGERLTGETLRLAVGLRLEIVRRKLRAQARGGWYFGVWQPDFAEIPGGGKIPFAEADPSFLSQNRSPWIIRPGDGWHGFSEMREPDAAMLDPLKITITIPGFDANSCAAPRGIPAKAVSRFLESRGIICEKTDFYSFLLLHSLGIEKAQHGRLLDALDEFAEMYDADAPLSEAAPELAAEFPEAYGKERLRAHCDKMHAFISEARMVEKMNRAFRTLPERRMKPSAAFGRVVDGGAEYVPVRGLAGRTAATAIIPYPPGTPLILGGEMWGDSGIAVRDYLAALEDFETAFPGYETEIIGVSKSVDGKRAKFSALCLKS